MYHGKVVDCEGRNTKNVKRSDHEVF